MKLRSNPFAAISIALISATTLQAGILYWDGTDTAATVPGANGGAGTWDTVLTNWNDAAIAGNPVAWPSSGTDNDAVFGTPAGIVTIDAGGVSANDLTFGLTGYTVDGGTLTLNGATNILTSTAAVSSSSVTNLTISAALAGTNGLTKAGVGHVLLSGNNTGLSGIITINNATGTNNSAVTLSGANAPGGITQVDVGGTAAADGSFLALANTTLGSGVTVNLSGQGGNSAPPGTLRSTGGAVTVNGLVNLLTANVRIANFGGTSLTLNGAVTTTPSTNGMSVRFAQNQGVIMTNGANNWGGTTVLGEGSLYCFPEALPATTNLQIGASNSGDFGTYGSFTRALGIAAGQVQFGKGNDGQRANGFTARGGALTVNLGNAAADVLFLNTFAKTGATNATTTVTVAITNLVVGMSVTGSGIPADTLISAIGATTITLSKAATTTVASNALTFYAAADAARINSSLLVLNGANADSPISLANPLDLNGFARTIQVSANTATLTGGLKNSSATVALLYKTGVGSLTLDPGAISQSLGAISANGGELILKSGTYATTAKDTAVSAYNVGAGARGGTLTIDGATLNVGGSGNNLKIAAAASGNLSIKSGIVTSGEMVIGHNGIGVATQSGGTVTVTNVYHQDGAFGSSYTLTGGSLTARRIYNNTATTQDFTLNLNGGTLKSASGTTNLIDNQNIGTQIAVLLGDGNTIIDTTASNATIVRPIGDMPSVAGTFTKAGNNTLTLTGANTYTGATSVTLGTLALVGGSHQSPITVDSGAALGFTLGSATTSTSTVTFSGATAKVTVTGTPVAATLMTATNITGTPVLDPAIPGFVLAIEGSGTQLNLKATSGGPFDTWATTTNGLAGLDAATTADPDNDGLKNAVEFVIGGQPNPANPNSNSNALAPTVSTDASNLIFTFRRTDLSLTQPGIGIVAEYGSNLTGWTTATNGVNGVAIVVTNDIESGVDQVQVSIPKALATGAKMFARLNVVIP